MLSSALARASRLRVRATYLLKDPNVLESPSPSHHEVLLLLLQCSPRKAHPHPHQEQRREVVVVVVGKMEVKVKHHHPNQPHHETPPPQARTLARPPHPQKSHHQERHHQSHHQRHEHPQSRHRRRRHCCAYSHSHSTWTSSPAWLNEFPRVKPRLFEEEGRTGGRGENTGQNYRRLLWDHSRGGSPKTTCKGPYS